MSSSKHTDVSELGCADGVQSKVKVVIIGAGMAGVTAAAKLFHSGVNDLVVVEAQDYVGGRIKAEVVDGQNIDMGAQFVHGQVDNPLFSIAQTLGIVIDDTVEDSCKTTPVIGCARHIRLCSNGEKKVREEALNDFLELIEEDNLNIEPATLSDALSVGDVYMRSYDRYMKEHREDMCPRTKELIDATYRSLCSKTKIDNAAVDLCDLSRWACLEYRELEGNRYNELNGGMTLLLKAIVSLLPDGIIHTNSPVTSIKWNQGDDKHHKSIVTCDNGKIYGADYVIVTISSRCLMEGLSMFNPPLPSTFTAALGGLQLGVIGKVYLQWETPFWDRKALMQEMQGDTVIDFLWLKSNPITISCDTTKEQTRYGKPWWEGAVGCELLTFRPDMLEFWFSEEQVEILEHVTDDEVMSVLHELLQRFFNKDNIPKPIAVYRSMWLNNPFVRGTYTYPKTSFGRTDMDILTTPLPSVEDPQLLFAGEALSLESIGSAHGAYNSGQQNADAILKSLGIEASKWLDVSKLVYNQIKSGP